MTIRTKKNNILYYSLCISVSIHVLFLFMAFGKGSTRIQKHELKVTMRTHVVLPRVENPGDYTRLKNNPAQPMKQQNGIMASQYSVSDDDYQNITMRYTDMIRQRIQEMLVYPVEARKNGIEGRVYVKFTINKKGSVIFAIIERSSGYALLDEASLKAIYSASPFPHIPDTINKEYMTFVQGLTFTLK